MIETIIQVENHVYPFEEEVSHKDMVKVEDVQIFSNVKELLEKKGEMQIKSKLVDSPYLIRLLKIYQEDLTLHYLY